MPAKQTYNFTLRVYKNDHPDTILSSIQNLTLSDITLVSKPNKFGGICTHKSNQKKYGYTIEIIGKFLNAAGSNSSPILAFKGDYIYIVINNFPRYPVLTQDRYVANSLMKTSWAGRIDKNGNYSSINILGNGFPYALQYRKMDIIFDSGKTLKLGL